MYGDQKSESQVQKGEGQEVLSHAGYVQQELGQLHRKLKGSLLQLERLMRLMGPRSLDREP